MKYDYVIAFGDSTPTGMELLPTDDWDQTKKLSYPNKLADLLGIPCINLAMVAYRNDRSLRLLPETLLKYPNSLVLFNYTFFDRTEFFTTDPTLPQILSEGYYPIGINLSRGNGQNKKHNELIDMYFKYFYEDTDPYNRYRSYNMLLTVQTLCEKFAKNYVQIFPYNGLLLSSIYQEEIYNAIDKSHIFQFDHANDNIDWKINNQGFGSLNNWARNKKYKFGPLNHVLQEAHNHFANDLFERVK